MKINHIQSQKVTYLGIFNVSRVAILKKGQILWGENLRFPLEAQLNNLNKFSLCLVTVLDVYLIHVCETMPPWTNLQHFQAIVLYSELHLLSGWTCENLGKAIYQ